MDKQKIEARFEVKNETEEVAELYLYGTIRESYWWDEEEENIISSKRVKNALNNITAKKINIHINSGGGDVFESIAIGNILKQHDAEINIIIDGLAGSGASIVAMAGDNVKMFGNSMMMIHKAWTFAMGNADEIRKVADDLDKIDTSVLASYKNKFVGTEEELKDLIGDESWLTAEECKTFGFCNEIIDIVEEPEEPKASARVSLFEKYKVEEKPKEEQKNIFKNFRRNE